MHMKKKRYFNILAKGPVICPFFSKNKL